MKRYVYKLLKPCNFLFKRKRLKPTAIITFLISTIGFVSYLLVGDLRVPSITKLTELNRCPACYGVTLCPELFAGKINVDGFPLFSTLINVKNVYYGLTVNKKKVVLKKLAHQWELELLDKFLCSEVGKDENCKASDIVKDANVDIFGMIERTVAFEQLDQKEVRKGLILCPYTHGLQEILAVLKSKSNVFDKNSFLLNFWTIINVNPEPILLQLMPASEGWPVPAYAGACGRLIVASFNGEMLSNMLHVLYTRRLNYAHQLLKAALDFTFKHERFRFYFMDWSLDNFVVDSNERVTMVDLEDVIILDKQTSPMASLPDWYKRYSRENVIQGFTFSIDNICKHHLSDHNLWAVCYILAAEDVSLLYPIPQDVKRKEDLHILLNKCLYGDDKFTTVDKLQELISDIIVDLSSPS